MAKRTIDRKRWTDANGRRMETLTPRRNPVPHAVHLEYGSHRLRTVGKRRADRTGLDPVGQLGEFARAAVVSGLAFEQLAGCQLERNQPAASGDTRYHRPGDPAGRHRDDPSPQPVAKLRVVTDGERARPQHGG